MVGIYLLVGKVGTYLMSQSYASFKQFQYMDIEMAF